MAGWKFYFDGNLIKKISDITIKEGLTEPMAFFRATMIHPNDTERAAFAIGHILASHRVQIYRKSVLKFDGFLEAANPSGLDMVLEGRSFEVLLLDERTSRDIEYIAKTGEQILRNSVDSSGIVPTYSTKITEYDITYPDTLSGTVRFNHDNLLKGVAKVCNINSKDFWVSRSATPAFKLHAGTRGSGSSGAPTGTYYAGKDIRITLEKQNARDIINRIRVFGSGDGINQLQCCVPYIDVNLVDNDRSAGFDGINASCEHADATTSQGTHGIMEGKPHIDRSISSLSNAIEIAKTILDENASLYKNLSVDFAKYTNHILGDWIRIIDVKKNLDVTTRVKALTHNFSIMGQDSIEVVLYNPFKTTEDRINIAERDSDTTNTSGQGATNIFQIASYENCDNAHPLSLRFRLPDDIVQVNKVLVSFKLEDYRAYHSANASESAHTHALNVWNYHASYDCGILGTQDIAGEHRMVVPAGGVAPSATAAGSAHTHGVTYGISEQALSSPSVIVAAGSEGSESAISGSPFTVDGTDIDITSQIGTSGNWYNVKFTPNQNMRIEANIYVKCYIESK